MPTDGNASFAAGEHRTASRVMAILEMVAADEPNGLRLGDLAARLDAPKSSVHGLTKGLAAVGYLREQDGRYFTGPAMLSLLGAGDAQVSAAIHHAMEQLTESFGETTYLARLVGDSIVYVDRVESTRWSIRASVRLNTRFPLWPRSAGKVFLAFMEPRQQTSALRKLAIDPNDMPRVNKELAEISESGISANLAETEPDHFGIAAAIRFGQVPVTMAMVLAGPSARIGPRLDELRQSLGVTAAQLGS